MAEQGKRWRGATICIRSGTVTYSPFGSSAEFLAALNDQVHQPPLARVAVAAGLGLAFLLLFVHYTVALVVLGGAVYACVLLARADAERRAFHLRYVLDDVAADYWQRLRESFGRLGRAERVWSVSGHTPTADWKRQAGATSLLSRAPVQLGARRLPLIAATVTPHAIVVAGQQLFFMPDMVYILQGGTYYGLEYRSLYVVAEETNFVEAERLPGDAHVTGTTWRYVNRDGSPDRRFAANQELPVARYGVVRLCATSGYELTLYVSSVDVASDFVRAFGALLLPRAGPKVASSEGVRGSSSPRPRSQAQRQQRPEQRAEGSSRAAASPPPPDCHVALGLRVDCTREEAAARYRQLVRQYHPDQVSNMGPEVRRVAEDRMKEINAAYKELKQLHDW